MNAEPLIRRIVAAAAEARLEMIVIGNAGAALQGAPVTTMDIDFLVRDIDSQMAKIGIFARLLEAAIIRHDTAITRLVQIENSRTGVFVDLIDTAAGMPSFASVRRRATPLDVGVPGARIYVASLHDIVASKKTLGRPKDLAVLPILEMTLEESEAKDAPPAP